MFKTISQRYVVFTNSLNDDSATTPGLFLSNQIYPALGVGGHASLSHKQNACIDLEIKLPDAGCLSFSSETIALPNPYSEPVRFYIQQMHDPKKMMLYFDSNYKDHKSLLVPEGFEPSIYAEKLASKDRKVHEGDAGQKVLDENSSLNNLPVVLKLIETLLKESVPKSKLGRLVLAECFIKRVTEIGGKELHRLNRESGDSEFYVTYCASLLNEILDSNFSLTIVLPTETQQIDTKTKVRDLQDITLDFSKSEAFGFDDLEQLTGRITLNSAQNDVKATQDSKAKCQVFRFDVTIGDSSSDPAPTILLETHLLDSTEDGEPFGFDPADVRDEFPIETQRSKQSIGTTQVLTLETDDYEEGNANDFIYRASQDTSKASLKGLIFEIESHCSQKEDESLVDDLLDEADMSLFAPSKDLPLLWVKSVLEKILSAQEDKAISLLRQNEHKLDVHPLVMKLRYTGLQQVVDDIAMLIQDNPNSKKWNFKIQKSLSDLLKKGQEMEKIAKIKTEKEDAKGIVYKTWNQVLPKLHRDWTEYQTRLNTALPGFKTA